LGYIFNNRFGLLSGFAEVVGAVLFLKDDNITLFQLGIGFTEPPDALKLGT
jgi:hypothetical protein